MVYNDGLISSLDVQLTDLSGRPAKTEHLYVDQDEALIFYFFYFYFYCLFVMVGMCNWRTSVVSVG